jgi:hypothetical protein
MKPKRFRIAFSFAGEKRDFVGQVAAILARQFDEEHVLYDKYHEAEFARHDLGLYLPKLYGEQSDLIVPVLCPNYDVKRWTGWEWLHIYGLLTKSDGKRVMLTRFEYANADGLSEAAGFIELDDKTPDDLALLILERLALNEGSSLTLSSSKTGSRKLFRTPVALSKYTPSCVPRNLNWLAGLSWNAQTDFLVVKGLRWK